MGQYLRTPVSNIEPLIPHPWLDSQKVSLISTFRRTTSEGPSETASNWSSVRVLGSGI